VTIDLETADGSRIRSRSNARSDSHGRQPVDAGRRADQESAFDVTPHQLIAGIITERGILRPRISSALQRAPSSSALSGPETNHGACSAVSAVIVL
jgi:methylthioribose-1-phosphate isomerase